MWTENVCSDLNQGPTAAFCREIQGQGSTVVLHALYQLYLKVKTIS